MSDPVYAVLTDAADAAEVRAAIESVL